jgi:peptidoglycan hydrolase CwlO-like protein
MPLIVMLISRYWKPLALAVLVTAALAYRSILIHERNAALDKVAQLTAEAAALRTSNQALGKMIDRQNAGVAELRAKADAAVAAMESSEEAAAREGAAVQGKAEQQASALMAAPIDAASGCDGAIRWGNARAAELSSW